MIYALVRHHAKCIFIRFKINDVTERLIRNNNCYYITLLALLLSYIHRFTFCYVYSIRDVIVATRQVGQMTIPFHAMMV